MTTPRKRVLIVAGVAAALVVAGAGALFAGGGNSQPTSVIGTRSVTFDREAFATWWSSGAVPASVQAVTDPERIQWTGVALAAETSIYPDGDAEAAARAVCSALSAYWLSIGSEVRPVQVLGTDGGVLVSRRSAADGCEWRSNS